MSKNLIFVLGMHRSGTSALTRMLNLLGATLGDNLLEAQAAVNERGFWEHKALLSINERILDSLGRRWYDITPMPADWSNSAELVGYRSTIRDFVEKNFSTERLSAVKDPRLCRILSVWLKALQGCDIDLSAVLVLRDPHEVVASICARDPLDETTAYLLWALHARDAELESRKLPRSIVSYQQLLTDWRTTAAQVSGDTGIKWPINAADAAAQIDTEIDPDLQHQHRRQKNNSSGIAALCQRIFDAHIDRESLSNSTRLDALWQELDDFLLVSEELIGSLSANNRQLLDQLPEKLALGQQLDDLRAVVAERETALDSTQKQMQALGLEHKHSLETISKRDGMLREVQSKLDEMGAQHQHALDIIVERDQQLDQLGAQHQHALAVIEERDQQLNQLGPQHQHALEVIEERDQQLASLSASLKQTEETLAALQSTFAVRAANKLGRLTGHK